MPSPLPSWQGAERASGTSGGFQLEHLGKGLLGTGVEQVGALCGVKCLPVSAANGGEVVSCHEAFIALPPAWERQSAGGFAPSSIIPQWFEDGRHTLCLEAWQKWEAEAAGSPCAHSVPSPDHPLAVPMSPHCPQAHPNSWAVPGLAELSPCPSHAAVPVDNAVNGEGEAIKGVCYHQKGVVSHREELPVQGTGGQSRQRWVRCAQPTLSSGTWPSHPHLVLPQLHCNLLPRICLPLPSSKSFCIGSVQSHMNPPADPYVFWGVQGKAMDYATPQPLAQVPVGEEVLEFDKHLGSDVQLVDGGVDGIEVRRCWDPAVVAVAVGHSQEDSVPDVEDLPVSSPKSLRRKKPSEKLPWTQTSLCDPSTGKHSGTCCRGSGEVTCS